MQKYIKITSLILYLIISEVVEIKDKLEEGQVSEAKENILKGLDLPLQVERKKIVDHGGGQIGLKSSFSNSCVSHWGNYLISFCFSSSYLKEE